MDDFGVPLFLETPTYIYIPRKSKHQTLPLGSRESFISIIPKTILCSVLDFQGILYIIYITLCLLRICCKLYYNVISKSCIKFLCTGLVGIIWALRLSTMDSGSPTVWDARFSGLWRMQGGCEMEAIWVALSGEWGNIHGYDGDSFPHSVLSASQ